MRRGHMLWMGLCLLALCLAACAGEGEDPYRVDTVIHIPVDPTEETVPPMEATEPVTEPTDPTEPATEPTEAAETEPGKPGRPSGSSGGGTKATEPPTEPPTEPEVVWTELPTDPPEVNEEHTPGTLEYEILERINTRRTGEGAEALTMDDRLCALAAVRAQEAALLWSHTRPDGTGWETVLSGYGCARWAEHLTYASGTADASLAQGWLDTPSNAESLLDPGFTTAGIGIHTENGVTYVALLITG